VSFAACSSSSDSDTSTSAGNEATSPSNGDAGATPNTPTEGGGDIEVSEGNPLVLGFEISGPAGTVIETTTTTVVDVQEQPKLDQTWQLSGEPKWQLFTPFVDGAVMTLKVTKGGPAKVVGFRGNAKDPNDPTVGYVVSEELSTVELTSGKTSVLSLP
jgi:hypothetical protein